MTTKIKKTKYLQVREAVLAESMANGIDAIPSERILAKKYGVSRITAKKALDSMAADNLVTRHVGQGTFLIREKAKTKIRLYASTKPTELIPFFREAGKQFSKQHPDIDVEICTLQEADITTSMLMKPGAKITCLPKISSLAAMNTLEPLQELDGYDTILHTVPSQYLEQLDGQTYSLPLFLLPEMVGFNRSLASELGLDASNGPSDWEDMSNWAKAMSGHPICKGSGAAAFVAKGSYNLPISFYLAASRGRQYIEEKNGDFSLNFEHGEKWFRFFQSFAQIDSVKPFIGFRFSPLLKGESLFSFKVGPWIIKQSEHVGGMDNIGLSLIPPPEKNAPSFCEILKWNLALVRDDQLSDKEKYAAWEFMKYLVSDEGQHLLLSQFSVISVNRYVYEEQQATPSWYPFFQAMATGRMRCDHPLQFIIYRILHKYYEAAVFENMPVEEAVLKFINSSQLLFDLHLEKRPDSFVQFF